MSTKWLHNFTSTLMQYQLMYCADRVEKKESQEGWRSELADGGSLPLAPTPPRSSSLIGDWRQQHTTGMAQRSL